MGDYFVLKLLKFMIKDKFVFAMKRIQMITLDKVRYLRKDQR
jgi:hypothetical protein